MIMKCGYCSSDAGLWCSGCGALPYCGKSCQASDWPKHRDSCTRTRGISASDLFDYFAHVTEVSPKLAVAMVEGATIGQMQRFMASIHKTVPMPDDLAGEYVDYSVEFDCNTLLLAGVDMTTFGVTWPSDRLRDIDRHISRVLGYTMLYGHKDNITHTNNANVDPLNLIKYTFL